MIVARWIIDARFGHKSAVLSLADEWWSRIAPQIGWSRDQVRVLNGSIGAPEARIEVEVELRDLGALHDGWSRLASADGQADWADRLAEYIVHGSPRWEILRIV